MRPSSFAVLCAILIALACFASVCRGLTEAEQDAVLSKHNQYRQDRGLPLLSYSTDAEDYADESTSCSMAHTNTGGQYGENLYWRQTALSSVTAALDQAVELWVESEEDNYNCKTGRCSGGVCGHYTQVMWESTTGVGCSYLSGCSGTIAYDIRVQCNYEPPGNFQNQHAFSIDNCEDYPYFDDHQYVVTLTIEGAYNEQNLINSIADFLEIEGVQVYVIGTTTEGGQVVVDLYIVPLDSNNGYSLGKQVVAEANSNPATFAGAGTVTSASICCDKSAASSLVNPLALLLEALF